MMINAYIAAEFVRGDYKGKRLSVLDHWSLKATWDKYPCVITESQISSIEFPHLLKLMRGEIQIPSQMANLGPLVETFSHAVQKIDEISRVYFKKYEEDLKRSTALDEETIEDLILKNSRKYLCSYYLYSFFGRFGFGKTWAAILNGIALNGSAHRLRWLYEVNLSEKNRLEHCKMILENNADILYTQLKLIEAGGERDYGKARHLNQISKVYKVLFPAQRLEVENDSIDSYLDRLQINP